MVRSFSLHMEGLSPAALALNLAADRVCVGGRNIFKVFGVNIPDQDDQVAVKWLLSMTVVRTYVTNFKRIQQICLHKRRLT